MSIKSSIAIAPPVKVSGSLGVLITWAPGTVKSGWSFKGVTVIFTVWVSVGIPPCPKLPESSAITVRLSIPLKSGLLWYSTLLLIARTLLISLKLPVRVTELVPLPLTVTPLPSTIVIVPWVTLKVTVLLVELKVSASLILIPLTEKEVSSLTVWSPGTTILGESFVVETLIWVVLVKVLLVSFTGVPSSFTRVPSLLVTPPLAPVTVPLPSRMRSSTVTCKETESSKSSLTW